MPKKFIVTYMLIFIILLVLMSLSHSTNEKIREKSVSAAAPIFEKILSLKHFLLHPLSPSPFFSLSIEEEKQRLLVENQLLQTENSFLQKQLNEQLLITLQLSRMHSDEPNANASYEDTARKIIQKKADLIQQRLKALPARVIFRSLDSWQQMLWINVGESLNQDKENPVIALNSPVVIGCAIVGVIDWLGTNQSRVRLITDNRLNPSVRASRGSEHDFLMHEKIQSLLQHLAHKKPSPLTHEEYIQLSNLLKKYIKGLQPFKKSSYLAKGELNGSPTSSRMGENGCYLTGTGFNYDFPDEEGESRDLRSGKLMSNPKEQAIPILKINDILVSTGMDGVFPPGFQVAIVTRIGLLKEGDYSYDLEARPIAGPLEELSLVFVLPPLKTQEFLPDRK